ncbi:MAG: MarR family EPS-associated transcriptional regulator [SAR86 cluster bacterium]|nr:MarR family EPS-associated transcriptional regulator [SAR86 cluster bacterium]|tara:strand:- start:122 stop:457 length:336 start_codon:yes stop_codon:yes gene_type:complete
MKEEIELKVINSIADHPDITQRDLARLLGISLGKVNYCIKSLIDKGFIKINNFKNNKNKLAYHYLFTPKGIDEKSRLTLEFLKIKLEEHRNLTQEIKDLEKMCKQLQKSDN